MSNHPDSASEEFADAPIAASNSLRRDSALPVISGLFVAILVLVPSMSSKFIAVGSLAIAGSTLMFPVSYIFNDVLTEVYGYSRARRIIWTGLVAQVFAALFYWVIQVWPAASFWNNQAAYDSILGQAPRIVAGSLSAYFLGEFVNSYIVSRMKRWQNGKRGSAQALRFVISTIFGEAIDSFVFMTISFYGVISAANLASTVITIWVLKTLYEILLLPISLSFANWLKRHEACDVVDPASTNYNPFQV